MPSVIASDSYNSTDMAILADYPGILPFPLFSSLSVFLHFRPVAFVVQDAQEEKYFGHPRIRLICLQISLVVPGNKRGGQRRTVNSTVEQLEYECTHIRDFDVLLS